jgi:hypothetical protein
MLEAQKGREQVEAKAAKVKEEKKKEMKIILKEALTVDAPRHEPIIKDIGKLPDLPQVFEGEAELDMRIIMRRLEIMAEEMNTTVNTILRKCGMSHHQASVVYRRKGVGKTKYGQFLLKLTGVSPDHV